MNKKIRLLFITYTHSNGGGAEKILTTLVNNLDSAKYDISIFEIVQYDVKQEPINKNIKLLPPLYRHNDRDYKIKVLDHILEQKPEIIRAINNFNVYDVIVTWNYQKPSFMLPAFQDKKIIAWFHGAIDDLNISENFPAIKYRYDLQQKVWNYADKIITISNKSLRSLKQVFPEYMYKSGIIHNPLDINDIQKKAKDPVMFDFQNYTFPFLICIGRLDKNKNVSLVIQSIAKLNRIGTLCRLLILGIGEEEKNLKAEAKTLNISDKTFFLGYQQNPIPYLSQARVLCVSSFAEGFPTVVCEAMALGIPFVTTPIAGASEELADDGKCGLVADWNVDDYAKKIKTLLTDTALYDTMSNNCRERIKGFSVENTVRQFDNLIASLPEKQSAAINLMTKKQACRQAKYLYVWYPEAILKRITFSITRFRTEKTIYHFMLLCYHIVNFARYVLCTPCRFVSAEKLLS